MAVEDIYSKRQKRLRGETPDVYRYDEVPSPLRVQILGILEDIFGDGIGNASDRFSNESFARITKALRREYGVLQLPGNDRPFEGVEFFELRTFLLTGADHEQVLDAVEVSFNDRATPLPHGFRQLAELTRSGRLPRAIAELNARFKEHGVGYQFVEGRIVRVDSQYIHAAVVVPALALLQGAAFAGAEQEFLHAHEHLRHGRTKEAINDCLKAIESVLKAICAKRGWKHPPNVTSNGLLNLVFEEELVSAVWQQHFNSLRSCLESGVPTGRNSQAGHGQGSQVTDVPEHIAAFMLHETASAIVFLVEADKAMK